VPSGFTVAEMRPPEAKNLLWRDVSITTIRKDTRGRENKSVELHFGAEQLEKIADDGADASKGRRRWTEEEQRKIVVLNVRGKDKNRRLVAPSNVAEYLERIRAIAKAKDPDDHVFSTYAGKRASTLYTSLVRDLFTYAKLLKGPAGTDRSTYSFRHTYATLRLSEGVDSIFLAEQMGTSVRILEEHYGHINPVKNADRILMGTVAITQASIGAGMSAISNRRQTNANPRGTPSQGSMVHCSVFDELSSLPSLKVCITTMPRWPSRNASRNAGVLSMVSERA
jgi:integrase